MDEKKKVNTTVVIINCFCAVVWNLNIFVDLFYGYTNYVSFVLHIICAIAWDICAIVWVARYIKEKGSDKHP